MNKVEQRRKLERLKAVRGGHGGALTNLAREVDELLEDTLSLSEATAQLNIVHEQLEGKKEKRRY